jgi:hypothetical protein
MFRVGLGIAVDRTSRNTWFWETSFAGTQTGHSKVDLSPGNCQSAHPQKENFAKNLSKIACQAPKRLISLKPKEIELVIELCPTCYPVSRVKTKRESLVPPAGAFLFCFLIFSYNQPEFLYLATTNRLNHFISNI